MNLAHKITLGVFLFFLGFLFIVKIILGGTWLQFLFLFIVLFVLCIFCYFILFKKITKRVLNLALSVEEMAAGNFLKNFASDDKDEVGQLSNSIEELKIKLKTGVAIDASKNKEIDKIKTDFVTIASHQLRTPLSIIKWYTDFLITGDAGAITKDQKHYLEEIYFSNERLIELVNALLDVSRIDLGTFSIDPELTDIVDIANEAIHKFAKTIEDKKIKVEVDFDKFQKINLDPRLIKMVFENLISNSVKYTAETGKINVVIKKTEKNIFIKISDMGVGIPKDQQPKIFLKMFRADNARKIDAGGTGLGLFIVKAIIEKSGGKIWFESPSLDLLLEKERKSNKIDQTKMGTTFFITIPLTGMIKKKGEKQLM